jgi:hypothetical protein
MNGQRERKKDINAKEQKEGVGEKLVEERKLKRAEEKKKNKKKMEERDEGRNSERER